MTPACDFCGTGRGPFTPYPCAPHQQHLAGPRGRAVVVFQGDWYACRTCARLVDAGDRDGLLVAATAHLGTHPPAAAVAILRQAHQGFYRHRLKGAAA